MFRRFVSPALWFLLMAALTLPVLAVMLSWLELGGQSLPILQEMWQTVLPEYVLTSLLLCLAVATGVGLLGVTTACAVSLFEFPGRRFFAWALLLPLAMPAYVVAYAYTDFLQYAGPLQSWLRSSFGLQGRLLPEIRSLGGAMLVFTVTLYPYVYLLARTAMSERAVYLMEAARLLGAPLGRRIREVALPLARPAVAAGVALALMETLADFGVSSYFGIQTFTAGIYKAWLAMDNRLAAAQLATALLLVVAVLLKIERHAQNRMRFAGSRGGRAGAADAAPIVLSGLRAVLAWVLCALPIALGFGLPVLFMLRPLTAAWGELPWSQFAGWAMNSVGLASLSALLATGIALGLAFSLRGRPHFLTRFAAQLASLGYAVPGAVIVVGLLLPLGWLQAVAPSSTAGYWITGTVLGVVWAYLVRFTAVALQSVQSGYSRIPASFDDSARMLGTTGPALLGRVHWPLLNRSIGAAALLVFVDVMKELPATLVLRPFNSDTLAVVTYQLARDERLGEAALPALALVLVGLLPVLLLGRTLKGR
ncbi:MAG: iron ABC transporter permease [Polaromonas sp.]|uniref:ABC transporter permease n=1 Tax=Polaromonas sp. TaxID=1869339 RepID=UPI002730E758|nr:iron ABC transporter permease [Polaromonas sp.]MDP1739651.1 iron ABC transporter permease [Polaromonas sp.]MDP1955255.1 iron ABC transporter permease [Polaromonas sp.]MDP3356040.1 iron ABC transporter permease [Polaromonas sp.]MDP3751140.1 iron ABC transporter permease [Polaromonas sp.]